jgi:hypothetical protein
MTYFIKHGDRFHVSSEAAIDIHKTLPPRNFVIKYDERTDQYSLEQTNAYVMPSKLYGNIERQAARVLTTFDDRAKSTGILLAGEKGSGKTLLAKLLSLKASHLGIPTLILNQPFAGDTFNQFIQTIEQPCVILFDEFEKVYSNREIQQQILTLLDGVFPTKKLFILTCNNKWALDDHFHNRPGRLFYNFDYTGLDTDFIREYCKDVLKDQSYVEQMVKLSSIIGKFNFDMLQAIVEDMNRYGESPQETLQYINCKPADDIEHEVRVLVNGVELPYNQFDSSIKRNVAPLTLNRFHVSYYLTNGKESCDWTQIKMSQVDMTEYDLTSGTYHFKASHVGLNVKGKPNTNEVEIVLTRVKSTQPAYYSMLA